MMFDVQAETGLPMEYVEVSSLSVGRLWIIDHVCPPWPQRPIGPPGAVQEPQEARWAARLQGKPQDPFPLMSDENLAPKPRRDVV